MNTTLRARKRADLLSITGAALAGAAVGAWLEALLRPWLLPLLVLGLLIHAVGMASRHRLDRAEGPIPAGWLWFYRLCWVLLAALVLWVALATGTGR